MTTPHRPFQFSLRSLFIVTTLVAVVCSGLFAGPVWMTVLTLIALAVLIPIAITVALVYGRGYLRTFFFGASFPWAPLLFWESYAMVGVFYGGFALSDGGITRETRIAVAIGVGAMALVTFLCGLFAMLVRWLVERQQRPWPEEASGEPVAAAGDATASNCADEPAPLG